MKLSIIICVYNTERHYLEECLFSISESTLSLNLAGAAHVKYEICIVDDGSDLDYSDIVTKFNARYIKKKNGGILSARIAGIEMSRGNYITFVDSDDTVSIDYHRSMLEQAVSTDSDIVIGDWAFHTLRSRFFCKKDSTLCDEISERDGDVLHRFFRDEGREHSMYVVWNKIYKRDCMEMAVKDVKVLTYGRRMSYSEDVLLNFFAFKYAKRLENIHMGYYFYRIHSAQSVAVVSEERLERQISDMAFTLSVMKRYTPRESECIKKSIHNWSMLMSRTHFSYAKTGGYKSLYVYIKEMYRVEKLQMPTVKDGEVYAHTELLPGNFTEIDRSLLYLLRHGGTVKYRQGDEYTAACIMNFKKYRSDIAYDSTSACIIPQGKTEIKNRILHNRFVYLTANKIFKKGSKIRRILKKFF